MSITVERRSHERFVVAPMYSRIAVRLLDEDTFEHEGHCFDLSEGGVRFDLDRPIAPGTTVALRLDLPVNEVGLPEAGGIGRAVFAIANIVWVDDAEMPGGVRMAAAFTRFGHAGDRERLMNQFSSGRLARAA